jgi:hypothetical protein
MRTKLSNLLKPALLIGAVMCCFSVDAAYIPMPIPVYYGHSGGSMSIKEGISLLIALNIPSILIVIIRSIFWVIKRPDWTYVEYVWYSDMELITPDINTYWLVLLNGIVGVIALGMWIASVL